MILTKLLKLYLILIMIQSLLSWIKPDPTAPLMRLLAWITEPTLAPIRRIVPTVTIPGTGVRIDLAPLIILLIGGWILARFRF